MPHEGTIAIGEADLADLPRAAAARRIAYAGADPILFPGTLRDNLLYGLRRNPPAPPQDGGSEALRRLDEARRTGNPVEDVSAPWTDYAAAGARDADDLDRILVDFLRRMGLGEDIYRFGLSGLVDPARQPLLARHIIEARGRLRERLAAQRMTSLVEHFDPARYSRHATVAENLLFGAAARSMLTGRDLAGHRLVREVLDRERLTPELVGMGARIAETSIESSGTYRPATRCSSSSPSSARRNCTSTR